MVANTESYQVWDTATVKRLRWRTDLFTASFLNMPGQFWGAFLAPAASSFTSDWQPVSKPISILWLTGQMSASCFKSMRKYHIQRLVKALNPTVWLYKCVEVLCRLDSVSHSFSVTICFSPTLSPLSSPLAYSSGLCPAHPPLPRVALLEFSWSFYLAQFRWSLNLIQIDRCGWRGSVKQYTWYKQQCVLTDNVWSIQPNQV